MPMISFHLILLFILLCSNSSSEIFWQGFSGTVKKVGDSTFQYFLLASDEKLVATFSCVCSEMQAQYFLPLVNLKRFPNKKNKMQTHFFVSFQSLIFEIERNWAYEIKTILFLNEKKNKKLNRACLLIKW